eukprot:345115_1
MSEARKRYVKQLQKDRRKNVKQRREFEALTVKYPPGFDQFQNDEFDAGRVSNNSNASSEGGGSNAEEANRALTVDVKEVNKQLWYRMHARLLKKHAFAKILIPITMLFLVAPIVATVKYEDLRSHLGDGCMQQWHGAAAVLLFFAALYSIGFIFVAFKIRKVDDTYGIRNELFTIGLIEIIGSIPWYILNNLENDGVEDFNLVNSASTILLLSNVAALFFVSITWPLLNSYSWFRLPSFCRRRTEDVFDADHKSEVEDCEACLRNRVGVKIFEEHLEHSFAVQNLIFWQEMERFGIRMENWIRSEPNRTTLAKFRLAAQELYRQFIQAGAPFQMNIGHKLLKAIEKTMERCNTVDFLEDDDFIIDPIEAENMHKEATFQDAFGLIGEANENPSTVKMRALFQVLRVVQFECFKMLRDQYKFFKRTERYKELCAALERRKEQEMFVDGGEQLIHVDELRDMEAASSPTNSVSINVRE